MIISGHEYNRIEVFMTKYFAKHRKVMEEDMLIAYMEEEVYDEVDTEEELLKRYQITEAVVARIACQLRVCASA